MSDTVPAPLASPAAARYLYDDEVERALAIGAHPDDIDFGCSATVAQWVDVGIEVTYLLVTRGEAGGFDDTPRELIPGIREAEQRAAAAAVGVSDVRFLDGYADGDVQVDHRLIRDISRVIREVRPQRVLMQSPERNYQRLPASHPDHMATGEAALRAIYPAARNAFAYPELSAAGLEPWTVHDVWLVGHPVVDHYVDVEAGFDRKLASLRAHASQTAHMGEELDSMIRGWLTDNATRAGWGDDRLAEAYLRIAVP